MPAHRDAPPRRREIGLVGDRILAVGQVVGGVGQQLDQGDAHVGRGTLGPAGREQVEAVQHQPAEAGIVLGQVVDVGRADRPGRARLRLRAVEIRWAFDLEREFDPRQPRIESGRRVVAAGVRHQRQRVTRVVAFAVGADHQGARQVVDTVHQARLGLRGQGVGRCAPGHADARDALAAVDADVVGRQAEVVAQQAHEQRALARHAGRRGTVEHLDEVDRVVAAAAETAQHFQPARVAAMELHAPPPGSWIVVCCEVSSRSTR